MVYLPECIIFIGVLVASVVTASQFWLPQWLQLHGRGRASGFGASLNDPQSFDCMRASTVPSRLTRALLSLAWAELLFRTATGSFPCGRDRAHIAVETIFQWAASDLARPMMQTVQVRG